MYVYESPHRDRIGVWWGDYILSCHCFHLVRHTSVLVSQASPSQSICSLPTLSSNSSFWFWHICIFPPSFLTLHLAAVRASYFICLFTMIIWRTEKPSCVFHIWQIEFKKKTCFSGWRADTRINPSIHPGRIWTWFLYASLCLEPLHKHYYSIFEPPFADMSVKIDSEGWPEMV